MLKRVARLGVVSALAASVAMPAHAVDGNQAAYAYALRCFVAGGVSASDPQDNLNGSRSTEIRQRSRIAYDAAYRMGGVLGYTTDQVSADLDRYQYVEARRIIADPSYFADTKVACIRLGLM